MSCSDVYYNMIDRSTEIFISRKKKNNTGADVWMMVINQNLYIINHIILYYSN